MAITNYDGIIAARAAGKGDDRFFQKASVAGTVAAGAFWQSYLKGGGSPPAAVYGAATAGGSIMTATSVGAIPLNPATTGDAKYLLTMAAGAVGGAEVTIVGLVDVLWAGGAFQVNSSATHAVNSPALTRSTSGKFNMLGVVTATAITTAATMTVWYTDSGDTATSVAVVLPVSSPARMSPTGYLGVPIPNGIKSIQSCQIQTAQTAGAVDISIFRTLDFVPTVAANNWVERDMTAQIDGIMPLDMDTSLQCGCLAAVVLQGGTTNRPVTGMIRTVAG